MLMAGDTQLPISVSNHVLLYTNPIEYSIKRLQGPPFALAPGCQRASSSSSLLSLLPWQLKWLLC